MMLHFAVKKKKKIFKRITSTKVWVPCYCRWLVGDTGHQSGHLNVDVKKIVCTQLSILDLVFIIPVQCRYDVITNTANNTKSDTTSVPSSAQLHRLKSFYFMCIFDMTKNILATAISLSLSWFLWGVKRTVRLNSGF